MATATRAATITATAATTTIRRPQVAREVFKGATLLPPAPRPQVLASLRRPHLLPPHLALLYLPHTPAVSPTDQTALRQREAAMRALMTEGHTEPAEFVAAHSRFNDCRVAEREAELRSRTLVVVGTWLGAKERAAHKYTGMWQERGHPVLHFGCSVMDLLRPRQGAEVTAARVRDHLCSLHPSDRCILHAISVGGFIMQRLLMTPEPDITPRVQAQIYDSFTNWQNLPDGVANALPARFKNLGKRIGDLYVEYADLSSVKDAAEFVYSGKAVSPVLFLHSMSDEVAQYSKGTNLFLEAMANKTKIDSFLLPASLEVPHVKLLRTLGAPAYAALVERFLENHLDLSAPR